MKLQVLLSIMNKKDIKDHLKQMNIKKNYVVINQITKENIPLIKEESPFNKIISVKEKGLSKSRNLAIRNSEANLGLIADDDMCYVDDYESIITNAYLKYPMADIIAFEVEYEDKNIKKKTLKEGRLNFMTSMKISSVQITMNLDSIKDKKITFDELFGAGSTYIMGEENIFLSDCLKKKLKIYYVPIKIGTLKLAHQSSWFKGYNKEYFYSKGAVFYRMAKKIHILLILQFAYRKKHLYKQETSFLSATKWMLSGAKQYRLKKKKGK